MQKTVKSDSKTVLLEEARGILDSTRNILVTGLLRWFKSTIVLLWAVERGERFVYVSRTNATSEESIDKIKEHVANETDKRLVSCKGKKNICPRIREAIDEEIDVSYELVKIKHCHKCPLKPRPGNWTPQETKDMINHERIIDEERIDHYFREFGVCPTETILTALKKADFVFLTYAWLHFIKEVSGGGYKNLFKDRTVIYDEARHLEDFGVHREKVGTAGKNELSEQIGQYVSLLEEVGILTQFKAYADLESVGLMIEPLREFKRVLDELEPGKSMVFHYPEEELKEAKKELGAILTASLMFADEHKRFLIEQASMRLLWLEAVNGGEVFLDSNDVLYADENELVMTIRKDKEKLVEILEETKRNIFIDSTPPPEHWTRLWLGCDLEVDKLVFLPETTPDIKMLVENRGRNWGQVFKHKNNQDALVGLVRGICREGEEWVISVRSNNERQMLRRNGIEHKIVYQRGTESEGVQLRGNHLLTGIQYIHSRAFKTQKRYVEKEIGVTNWSGYLRYKSAEAFVQQMFRTFESGKPARIILLGTTMKEISLMKRQFEYLRLVDFKPMFWERSDPEVKVRQARYLIENGEFMTEKDFVSEKVREMFDGGSVLSITDMRNALASQVRRHVSDVVDELVEERWLVPAAREGVRGYMRSPLADATRENVRSMFPWSFYAYQNGDGAWSRWEPVRAVEIPGLAETARKQKVSLATSAFLYLNDSRKTEPRIGDFCMDFDSPGDVERAQKDAVRAMDYLNEKYGVDKRWFEISYTGSKGFLVRLPLECFWWGFVDDLHKTYGKLTDELAWHCPTLDKAVYSTKARLIRESNTIHPKTGRYRIELDYSEISSVGLDWIIRRSGRVKHLEKEKVALEPSEGLSERLRELTREVIYEERQKTALKNRYRYDNVKVEDVSDLGPRIQEIIKNGAYEGERNAKLCSLTGVLKGIGCSDEVIWKMTGEFARNSSPQIPEAELKKTVGYLLRNR